MSHSLTSEKVLWDIPPGLLGWPNKIRLGGVAEYYNSTIGMVSNDILDYFRPGEVLNNYTSGSGIDVNP